MVLQYSKHETSSNAPPPPLLSTHLMPTTSCVSDTPGRVEACARPRWLFTLLVPPVRNGSGRYRSDSLSPLLLCVCSPGLEMMPRWTYQRRGLTDHPTPRRIRNIKWKPSITWNCITIQRLTISRNFCFMQNTKRHCFNYDQVVFSRQTPTWYVVLPTYIGDCEETEYANPLINVKIHSKDW